MAQSNEDPKSLVSTQWLFDHLEDPDLRILDASWFLPNAGRDGAAEFVQSHIPNARFFDIDKISDHRSELPHMAPPAEKFISRVRALGVGDGHQVVVYDALGIFSAPRVWWNFRLMGKENIAVLDGGLPKWRTEGRPLTAEPPLIRDRHITVQRQAHLVKDVTQVANVAKLQCAQIIDARPADRFHGFAPEPRPGLRSGHIPNSKNVPWNSVLETNGTMKSVKMLKSVFEDAGVDLKQPLITSCGSGVSAAILSLALYRMGHHDHALYDASWAEWGMYADLSVTKG